MEQKAIPSLPVRNNHRLSRLNIRTRPRFH